MPVEMLVKEDIHKLIVSIENLFHNTEAFSANMKTFERYIVELTQKIDMVSKIPIMIDDRIPQMVKDLEKIIDTFDKKLEYYESEEYKMKIVKDYINDIELTMNKIKKVGKTEIQKQNKKKLVS